MLKIFIKNIITIFLLLLILIGILKVGERFFTEETITIVITNLSTRNSQGKNAYQVVYTKSEDFENRNDSYQDKHNTEYLISKFKKFGKYKVKVAGYNQKTNTGRNQGKDQ